MNYKIERYFCLKCENVFYTDVDPGFEVTRCCFCGSKKYELWKINNGENVNA